MSIALAIAFTTFGCTRDIPQEPSSSQAAVLMTQGNLDSIAIHDLPALIVDLPDEAGVPLDSSRLAEELRESEGLAFVGLKAADGARTSTNLTALPASTVSPSLLRHGLRPALTAEVLRTALGAVRQQGVQLVRYYQALGIALVKIPAASAVQLAEHPNVDFLTPLRPGPRLGLISTQATPLPTGGTQVTPWNIDSVGAPLAWPYARGSGARLLVIDSGHDWTHPDLGPVPWANCNRGGYTGCSDDYPQYHGTPVAGVAIARDNIEGVVGVAPDVQPADIYYWGACIGSTSCDYVEIVAALNWATDSLGPRGVINMSFSSPSTYYPEQVAVSAASAAGHVLVSISGNTGQSQVRYPAGYSGVIGVGAISQNRQRNPGSTFGSHVDFVAPWDAYSAIPANQYAWATGTSVAAPHVSGVALLLRAKYSSWTASDVFYRMKQTAEDLGTIGWDSEYGWGKIRAQIAVTLDPPSMTASVANGKPRMTWTAIPLAGAYRIYRRVTPTLAPNWALWAEVSGTSYTDTSTPVTAFYGYNTVPGSSTAVGYYVVALSGGVESGFGTFGTFLPNGIPPY